MVESSEATLSHKYLVGSSSGLGLRKDHLAFFCWALIFECWRFFLCLLEGGEQAAVVPDLPRVEQPLQLADLRSRKRTRLPRPQASSPARQEHQRRLHSCKGWCLP